MRAVGAACRETFVVQACVFLGPQVEQLLLLGISMTGFSFLLCMEAMIA